MRVSIYYKDTHFILNDVKGMGIIKLPNNETGRYRKCIFFQDAELGELIYPLTEIKELHVYED
jgi:hypothetical protein